MPPPFNFSFEDGTRDQAYLDHRNDRFADMEIDAKVPNTHNNFSSTLRTINHAFFNNPSQSGLSVRAQGQKNKTRAKNTTKGIRAFLDMSQFDVSSGLHEWIPTDQIGKIIALGDKRWMFLFNAMRCPTWLLVLNPEAHHEDLQTYRAKIQQAAEYAKMGGNSNGYVRASELGLNGHSAGLSVNRFGKSAKQLTTFQEEWHNELRRIFNDHKDANDFDGWANSLNNMMLRTFLFSSDLTLPGLTSADPPAAAVLDCILWDLNLVTYGDEKNPREFGSGPYSMLKVAQFLRQRWNEHMHLLSNSLNASKYVGWGQ